MESTFWRELEVSQELSRKKKLNAWYRPKSLSFSSTSLAMSILKILNFHIFQAACIEIFMFSILVIAVTMQVSLVEPAVVGTVSS